MRTSPLSVCLSLILGMCGWAPDGLAGRDDPLDWMALPLSLDGDIEDQALVLIGKSFRQALEKELGQELLYGPVALVQRSPDLPLGQDQIAQARAALSRGEDLYMAFKFAPAAAALAEAASLFHLSMSRLAPEDVTKLYRARLFEGLAWFDAGQAGAAKDAFSRLIRIRPDFEPDPAMVTPQAREIFRQALADVRKAGLADLELRSEPAGAEVILDGVSRGHAPIHLAALPLGEHNLLLRREGHRPQVEQLVLEKAGSVSRTIRLEPSELREAHDRLLASIRSGAAPELATGDLDLIARTAGLRSIVFLGVARLPAQAGEQDPPLVLTALRWTRTGRSAVALRTWSDQLEEACQRLAGRLAAGSWPPRLMPERDPPPVDFSLALLGLAPGRIGLAKDHPAPEPAFSIVEQWWFWTGLAVVAGAALGTGLYFGLSEEPVDQTRFVLRF